MFKGNKLNHFTDYGQGLLQGQTCKEVPQREPTDKVSYDLIKRLCTN